MSKELSTMEHKIANGLAAITAGLVAMVILSTGFWYLWNLTIPDMFPALRKISWPEAASIFVMAKILFRDKLITDNNHCECEYEEEEEQKNGNDKA